MPRGSTADALSQPPPQEWRSARERAERQEVTAGGARSRARVRDAHGLVRRAREGTAARRVHMHMYMCSTADAPRQPPTQTPEGTTERAERRQMMTGGANAWARVRGACGPSRHGREGSKERRAHRHMGSTADDSTQTATRESKSANVNVEQRAGTTGGARSRARTRNGHRLAQHTGEGTTERRVRGVSHAVCVQEMCAVISTVISKSLRASACRVLGIASGCSWAVLDRPWNLGNLRAAAVRAVVQVGLFAHGMCGGFRRS